MGCLNYEEHFDHCFGNIHLSGPCNRRCYFCIGQFMQSVDHLNNLDEWPLKNIKGFVQAINHKNIKEVNITGTNTDPLLYEHLIDLEHKLRRDIEGVTLGIRTNGIANLDPLFSYDQISISVTSLNPKIYSKTMGMGKPPDMRKIIALFGDEDLRVNVVLCEETKKEIMETVWELIKMGYKKINLREPYGQPHLGSPISTTPYGYLFDHVPYWRFNACQVVYWDVHFVGVESINLYANGHVSHDYPVTKGVDYNRGEVKSQEYFEFSCRKHEQWNS